MLTANVKCITIQVRLLVHVMITVALTPNAVVTTNEDTISATETNTLLCQNTTDFIKIVNCRTFVDKTILIQSFLEMERLTLVTAPRRFGKSVNMDMMKRFFEIVTDDKGVPQQIETTENYRLFVNNSLKISEYRDLIREHFGKYPVLFVDYKPLSEISNLTDMIQCIIKILSNTYSQHKYILESKNMNDADKDYFIKVCEGRNLSSYYHLKFGLQKLLYFIYTHFNKKVMILIDNYDVYIDNLIFSNISNTQANKILAFIVNMNLNLYKISKYVYRGLATGVLRIKTDEYNAIGGLNPGSHWRCICKLGLSRFYGLSNYEIRELFQKLLPSDEQKCWRSKIFDFFNYRVKDKDAIRFSYSVLSYLQTKNLTAVSQRQIDYLKRLAPIFEIPEITRDVTRMLYHSNVKSFIKSSLNGRDIRYLKRMLTLKEMSDVHRNTFFYFLNEHGYIAPESGRLTIPTMDNKLAFEQILDLVERRKNKSRIYNISIGSLRSQ